MLGLIKNHVTEIENTNIITDDKTFFKNVIEIDQKSIESEMKNSYIISPQKVKTVFDGVYIKSPKKEVDKTLELQYHQENGFATEKELENPQKTELVETKVFSPFILEQRSIQLKGMWFGKTIEEKAKSL